MVIGTGCFDPDLLSGDRLAAALAYLFRGARGGGVPAAEAMAARAADEGVAGWLHLAGERFGPVAGLSDSDRALFRRIHGRVTRNNLSILARALDLAERLSAAGFSAMALQGLSVLRQYPAPGMRPLSDMDLLVRQADAGRLIALLSEAGYRSAPRYPMLMEKAGLVVDVHADPFNRERIAAWRHLFPADTWPLWRRAANLFPDRPGLLVPDPADNATLLAAHAFKHGYSRLIWLLDLLCLLKTLGRDPSAGDLLQRRARYWGATAALTQALYLAGRVLGPDVPGGQWFPAERLSMAARHLLDLRAAGFSSELLCVLLAMEMIGARGVRFEFLRETIFPRREVMAQVGRADAPGVSAADYVRRGVDALCRGGGGLGRLIVFETRRVWQRLRVDP